MAILGADVSNSNTVSQSQWHEEGLHSNGCKSTSGLITMAGGALRHQVALLPLTSEHFDAEYRPDIAWRKGAGSGGAMWIYVGNIITFSVLARWAPANAWFWERRCRARARPPDPAVFFVVYCISARKSTTFRGGRRQIIQQRRDHIRHITQSFGWSVRLPAAA